MRGFPIRDDGAELEDYAEGRDSERKGKEGGGF